MSIKTEILSSVEFAVIKEYLEAEASISGISRITGLSQKIIRDIDQAPYYKAYMESLKLIHRTKLPKEAQADIIEGEMPWIELPLRNSPLKVKVDGDYDGEYFSQFKWRLAANGYVYRASSRRKDGEDHHWVYLAREVARPPEGMWVRFLNGDKLDCRSANLTWQTPRESALRRESRYTPEQKAQKVRKFITTRRASRRTGRSGYIGTSLHKGSSRWVAQISAKGVDGRRMNHYLGSYPTPELAARAYDLAEIKRHGFAQAITNFPKSDYLMKKEPR